MQIVSKSKQVGNFGGWVLFGLWSCGGELILIHSGVLAGVSDKL